MVLIIIQLQGGNRHRSVEHAFQFIRVLRLVLPPWLAACAGAASPRLLPAC